ncbi:MAG: hypothetical protein RRY40_03905, partial [Oscillospiraceae bacterium]
MKLKKISLALLMLIIISMTMSVMFSYATIPTVSALEKQIAVDDAGFSYVAFNNQFCCEIYKLQNDGETVDVYNEPNALGAVKSYISEITQSGTELYAVRQSINESLNATVCQEIIRLGNEDEWVIPTVIYTYQGVG